ncbi:MAG: Asp-tRNA(Asn)/Glu-tRNA(Gln) amidotransferase subunit GatA [Candidatus Omnitrophica bacterium]|nr:Asp-tRNA(Asn)/Glu-tRNA(Gln) amidotransferase subunit GatA [Candidatus Omnitrophota bacterium]
MSSARTSPRPLTERRSRRSSNALPDRAEIFSKCPRSSRINPKKPAVILSEKTASQLSALYKEKKCAPDETLKSLGEAVRAKDARTRAYIQFDPSRARRRDVSKDAPLWGVPIAVKDNICVADEEITCASKILQGFISPYHATVIEKLLAAGAVICGRTNMDEFAFGSSCETSFYGPTRNPRDPGRVPGGSSGGSAACVADHTAIAALGSDTGGSIRQPASLCGVVGIKPTYGRVSRYGLVAFASSLDQIGPITKDVRDAALLLGVLAGHDPKDSTSANLPVPDYPEVLGRPIKGMKIGIPREYLSSGSGQSGISPAVQKAVREDAVRVLERLGASCREVSLPHTAYAASTYYIIAPSEASSNLARFDGVRFGFRHRGGKNLLEMYEKTRGEGFGAEAKRRIILGTYSLSSGYYDAYYLRAMKVRTKIKNDFDEAFKQVDVLLTPTSPSTAFKLGEKSTDPVEMYLSDIYTISANLAGVPAISIPCGIEERAGKPLPIGLQFMAKPFDEAALFQVAHAFEQHTDFHKKLGNVKE